MLTVHIPVDISGITTLIKLFPSATGLFREGACELETLSPPLTADKYQNQDSNTHSKSSIHRNYTIWHN